MIYALRDLRPRLRCVLSHLPKLAYSLAVVLGPELNNINYAREAGTRARTTRTSRATHWPLRCPPVSNAIINYLTVPATVLAPLYLASSSFYLFVLFVLRRRIGDTLPKINIYIYIFFFLMMKYIIFISDCWIGWTNQKSDSFISFFLVFSCWLHCHSMEDFFFQVAVEGGAKAFLKTLRGSHPFYSRVPLLEESHLFPRVVNKYVRK